MYPIQAKEGRIHTGSPHAIRGGKRRIGLVSETGGKPRNKMRTDEQKIAAISIHQPDIMIWLVMGWFDKAGPASGVSLAGRRSGAGTLEL
jgi:hypothetical protein